MAEGTKREPTTMMIIGFVVGTVTVGVVIYFILKSLRETLDGLAGPRQIASGQPINIYNVTGSPGVALPVQPSSLGNQLQLGDGSSLTTKADTVKLSTGVSRRVFTAPRSGPMWRVRLHVLGPAGSFAAFAVDSSPDPTGANSMVVPSGGHTEVRLGARQAISGISIGRDTNVSFSASAEVV